MLTIADIIQGKHHKLIHHQIHVFLSWGERTGMTKRVYKYWLDQFERFVQREDVWDVTKEDVDSFLAYVRINHPADYQQVQAELSVRCLLRFYRARGKGAKSMFNVGRPRVPVYNK